MKVIHLSRAIGPADGGVAVAVEQLLQAQQANPQLATQWFTPATSPSQSLFQAVQVASADLLHVHGLWRSPTRVAARRLMKEPVVIAPHGMLDPWALAQHRRRKQLLLNLYERRTLQQAAAIQVLCTAEAEAVRQLGITAPIALIPNGVQPPTPIAAEQPAPWASQVPDGAKVLLFLGRLHPKKGLQPLLKAWQNLTTTAASGWWLVIVGYGDDGAIARQVQQEAIARTTVLGPCFDQAKAACLAQASAFILPSFSEGLPMAALEAMAAGLPCLLSPACNLAIASEQGAALNVEPTPTALQAALLQLFALSDRDRSTMAQTGRALALAHFSWSAIADQTFALYRWILGQGDRPSFVSLI